MQWRKFQPSVGFLVSNDSDDEIEQLFRWPSTFVDLNFLVLTMALEVSGIESLIMMRL